MAKVFNSALSGSLNALSDNQTKAGLTLVFISFLYGVFHAVGPRHGKFILTSYLSLEKTKLNQAMKITFASALVQGLVAVLLVTVIVVIFTLSRQYFNLTLKWVERASFAIMILLGLYWCYQVFKETKKVSKPKIKSIRFSQQVAQQPIVQKFHKNDRLFSIITTFTMNTVAVDINIYPPQMKCRKPKIGKHS